MLPFNNCYKQYFLMGRKGNRGANKGKVNINLEHRSKHSSDYEQPVIQGEYLSIMDEEEL